MRAIKHASVKKWPSPPGPPVPPLHLRPRPAAPRMTPPLHPCPAVPLSSTAATRRSVPFPPPSCSPQDASNPPRPLAWPAMTPFPSHPIAPTSPPPRRIPLCQTPAVLVAGARAAGSVQHSRASAKPEGRRRGLHGSLSRSVRVLSLFGASFRGRADRGWHVRRIAPWP